MKKRFMSLFLAVAMAVSLAGCRESDHVAYNISKEADSFNVTGS